MRTIQRARHIAQLDSLKDQKREAAIRAAHQALATANNRAARMAAWHRMAKLVRHRSPHVVERLEIELGLAPAVRPGRAS